MGKDQDGTGFADLVSKIFPLPMRYDVGKAEKPEKELQKCHYPLQPSDIVLILSNTSLFAKFHQDYQKRSKGGYGEPRKSDAAIIE